MYRHLHHHRPAFLRGAVSLDAQVLRTDKNRFTVTVTGGGEPLGGADVMVYLADAFRNVSTTTIAADADGRVSVTVPPGQCIVAVEPIPYAGYWIMVADAPSSGSTVDCLPLAKAGGTGNSWWHDVMRIDSIHAACLPCPD